MDVESAPWPQAGLRGDDAPINPGAAAAEDTIDVAGTADESADHLGARRPTDDSPIDLDGPSDCGEVRQAQCVSRSPIVSYKT